MGLCQYEYNDVFAGRNWNNGETVGKRVSLLENLLDNVAVACFQNLCFVGVTVCLFQRLG